MADNLAHPYGRRKSCSTLVLSPNDCWLIRCDVGQVVTIDDLSDDELLAIFDFCVIRSQDLGLFHEAILFVNPETIRMIESWQLLVHVCRRWRGLVFASPRRLNLQLLCMPGTSARRPLDVWPALPLLIKDHDSKASVDNAIAELDHSGRIHQIDLDCHTTLQIDKIWTAMQVPWDEKILGGTCGSDRCSSTLPVVDNILPRYRL